MVEINLPFITKIINFSFENGCFPEELKLAEVNPIFKKNDDLDKENYRHVIILSHVSKVFERIMYMQIDTFIRDKFKLLTGFRKNHSTQHCLMSMLEMWKYTFDKVGYVSAISMDLSKVIDTLNHNLLIARLGAYGFERDLLSFMKIYLNDRQRRARVNNNFSSWEKVMQELGKVQYLDSSFDLSNYTDGNTLYASGFNLEEVRNCLSTDFDAVTKWFYENNMALNAGKCHFMCLGKDKSNETFIFKGLVIEEQQRTKKYSGLLQIITDF